MILGEPSGIEHIASGGTVESIWSPEEDTAVSPPISIVQLFYQFLTEHGYPHISSDVLMLKDSREITIGDKGEIAQRVAESAMQKTVVTSGTYLMAEIGKRIQNHPSMQQNRFLKKVAMVASLIPLRGFTMSDGGFNLGMAQAVLESPRVTEPVVGVVNGAVAPIHKLEKDLTTATFENLDPSDNLLGYDSFTLVPAGGTIDFVFNGLDGVEPAPNSFIPSFLRHNVRTRTPFSAMPPILKDSRNLTNEDMDIVVDMIREAPTKHVLVTAGLIRIGELRDRVSQGLATGDDRDRNVFITGSRYLLNSAEFSDAAYNLGYACGQLGLVHAGVHLSVTGRVVADHEDPLSYCYKDSELKTLGIIK